jgi:hypothetical protein
MSSTGMSGPYIGLKQNGAMPYFRDLAAVKILAALLGAEYGHNGNLNTLSTHEAAKVAVQAADALEKALEKKP